jgi:hypothetical protein
VRAKKEVTERARKRKNRNRRNKRRPWTSTTT